MTYFIITIASLLIGYFLGKSQGNELDNLLDMIQQGKVLTTKQLERAGILAKSEIPTGQIKPKTAQDIQFKNRPTQEKEGMQAMRDTLDGIPELKKAKEFTRQLKKIDYL